MQSKIPLILETKEHVRLIAEPSPQTAAEMPTCHRAQPAASSEPKWRTEWAAGGSSKELEHSRIFFYAYTAEIKTFNEFPLLDNEENIYYNKERHIITNKAPLCDLSVHSSCLRWANQLFICFLPPWSLHYGGLQTR